MGKIISLEDLPDCESCQDPSKKRDGIIFDCPGPGEITTTYTCDNKSCKRRWNAIGSFILRQCRAETEEHHGYS